MPRSEITRRFVRGGARSLIVESLLVAALTGIGYAVAALLERAS